MKKFPRCRRWFVLCSLLWCVLPTMVVRLNAGPASAEESKAKITALLNDFLKNNSDPAQHDRFWAEDLVYTNNAGKVRTKPQIMKGLTEAKSAGTAKPVSTYAAEDVLVRVYGETAALTFRLVSRAPDGTVSNFRNSGTLLFRDGKWQVITWQATKEAPSTN